MVVVVVGVGSEVAGAGDVVDVAGADAVAAFVVVGDCVVTVTDADGVTGATPVETASGPSAAHDAVARHAAAKTRTTPRRR